MKNKKIKEVFRLLLPSSQFKTMTEADFVRFEDLLSLNGLEVMEQRISEKGRKIQVLSDFYHELFSICEEYIPNFESVYRLELNYSFVSTYNTNGEITITLTNRKIYEKIYQYNGVSLLEASVGIREKLECMKNRVTIEFGIDVDDEKEVDDGVA